ncbi:MAG: hypothetical protein ACE5FJ_00680 [Gemmatimonadales bacterium]
MPEFSENGQTVKVADIEVTEVLPGRTEFSLRGVGADRSDYTVELHLEVPVDSKTQTVLGELLAQSELRVWRSLRHPIKSRRTSPNKQRNTA